MQICTQDKENMKKKKNIHTQQSSSGQVPTYYILLYVCAGLKHVLKIAIRAIFRPDL